MTSSGAANSDDIVFRSAWATAAAIRAGEFTAVDAVNAYLRRIDAIDGDIRAYITVCREEALGAAADADAARRRGDAAAVGKGLFGVPIAVKDQFDTAGILTSNGSRAYADNVPAEDATVVARLKGAGAILLGKLNLSELAMGGTAEPPYGTPQNPWRAGHTPGESSSGSGAALAAHLCAASVGEDTGGSGRGPAAYCNAVGLRPTFTRVSRHGITPMCWFMDAAAPMTKTVEDCALLLQAIAGYDPLDTYSGRVPVPDYRAALTGDIRGVKVGLVTELMDPALGLDTQTREAVAAAAQTLADLGAEVRAVSLPLAAQTGAIVRTITSTERVSLRPEWLRERPQDYHFNTRVAFMTGNIIPAQVYYKAQKLRAVARRQVLDLLESVDVLIQPTSSGPAGRLDFTPGVGSKAAAARALVEGSFRGPYSLSGVPALSIPCGFTGDGEGALPLALQIAGRPYAEATVLRVGYAYEQATPWHSRKPPI